MQDPKDLMICIIEAKARRRVANLAHQLIRAPSQQRELVLAELDYTRWLAETCHLCRNSR